jgi:hypothetical protein
VLVIKDATLLKIVLGNNIPLPRSFSGITGCRERTINPQTNRTVLKTSNAAVYCFQFIGPVSRRDSNHRKNAQGRYFPSKIQAMYLLRGTATISVKRMTEIGRNHITKIS